MSIQDVTRLLVSLTLIEMMAAIGLEVTTTNLRVFARDRSLMVRAAVANYILVPAAAIVLLWALRAGPPVAAGFLILAACPGAPFGPPITAIAKGDVAAAAWLMALLAASSTLFAPLLLAGVLPFVVGPTRLEVDPIHMAILLAVTQLLPLFGGLLIRNRYPAWADAARKPARRLGAILSLMTVALILVTNFHALAEIRVAAYFGMLALLVASLESGAVLAGRDDRRRKALTLTTSLRNVGLALFIASTAFVDTAAATAIIAYGLMEITGSIIVAVVWGRMHYVRSDRVSQPVGVL